MPLGQTLKEVSWVKYQMHKMQCSLLTDNVLVSKNLPKFGCPDFLKAGNIQEVLPAAFLGSNLDFAIYSVTLGSHIFSVAQLLSTLYLIG